MLESPAAGVNCMPIVRGAAWFAGLVLTALLAGVAGGQQPGPAGDEPPAEQPDRPESQPLAIDAGADEALLQAAGSGFHLRHAKHFVCAYDTARQTAAELLARMERTYTTVCRFARIHDLSVDLPDRKLEVIFFRGYDDFLAYNQRTNADLPAEALGYYSPASGRSCFFNYETSPEFVELHRKLDRAEAMGEQLKAVRSAGGGADTHLTYTTIDGRRRTITRAQALDEIQQLDRQTRRLRLQMANYAERINCTVVQHEAAHQVLFHLGLQVPFADNPFWLVEGLATQFETPPGAYGAGLGAINQRRLGDFLRASDQGRSLQTPRLLSVEHLCFANPAEWPAHLQMSDLYAEAWALVYYLRRSNPDGFGQYMAALRQRRPDLPVTRQQERQAFEQAFGPADSNFTAKWLQFMRKLAYRSGQGVGG